MSRHDGRRPDQLRPLELVVDYLEQPLGSVLYSQGKTRVLCTASLDEQIPRWLRGSGRGWLTAEYSLLPASTGDRTEREASRGKQGGRTVDRPERAGEQPDRDQDQVHDRVKALRGFDFPRDRQPDTSQRERDDRHDQRRENR